MIYKFSISGYKFLLSDDFIKKYPSSLFNLMISSIEICDKDDNGYIFIQRCPIFGQIIYESIITDFNFNKFYHNVDMIYDADAFIDELNYYGIDPVFTCSGDIFLCTRDRVCIVYIHTVIFALDYGSNNKLQNIYITHTKKQNFYTKFDRNVDNLLYFNGSYGSSIYSLIDVGGMYATEKNIFRIKDFWFSIEINGIPINKFFEVKPIVSEKCCVLHFTLQKRSYLFI